MTFGREFTIKAFCCLLTLWSGYQDRNTIYLIWNSFVRRISNLVGFTLHCHWPASLSFNSLIVIAQRWFAWDFYNMFTATSNQVKFIIYLTFFCGRNIFFAFVMFNAAIFRSEVLAHSPRNPPWATWNTVNYWTNKQPVSWMTDILTFAFNFIPELTSFDCKVR